LLIRNYEKIAVKHGVKVVCCELIVLSA